MLRIKKHIAILALLLLITQKGNAAAVLTDAYWQGTNLVLQFSDSVLYQVDLVNTDSANVAVNLVGANLSAVATPGKVEPFIIDAPGGLSRATLTQVKANLVTLKIKLLPKHSYSVLWRPYSNRFYVYSHEWDKLTAAEKEFHKGLIALENGLKEQVEKQLASAAALGNKNARSVLGVFYAKVGSDELAEQYLANPTEADDYAALAEVKTRSGDKGLAFNYERRFQNIMKAQRVNSQTDSTTIVTGSQMFLNQLEAQKRKRSGLLNSLNDPMFITIILLVILLFIAVVFLLIRRSGNGSNDKPMSKKDFFKSSSRKKYYDYNNDYSNYYNKRKQDSESSSQNNPFSAQQKPNSTTDKSLKIYNLNQENTNPVSDLAETNDPLANKVFENINDNKITSGDELVTKAKSIIDDRVLKNIDKVSSSTSAENVSADSDSSIISDNIKQVNETKDSELSEFNLDKQSLDKQIEEDMLSDEALSAQLAKQKEEQIQEEIFQEEKFQEKVNQNDIKVILLDKQEADNDDQAQINIIEKYHEPEIHRIISEEDKLEQQVDEDYTTYVKKNSTTANQALKPFSEELKIPVISNEFLRHNRYTQKQSDKPKQLSLQALELRKKIEALQLSLQDNSSEESMETDTQENLTIQPTNILTEPSTNSKDKFLGEKIFISSGSINKRLSVPTAGEEASEIMVQARAEKVSRDYIMLKQLMSQASIYPRHI